MERASGNVNSDVILESTGPRLYTVTYGAYAAEVLRTARSVVGEFKARSLPSTCLFTRCWMHYCNKSSLAHFTLYMHGLLVMLV